MAKIHPTAIVEDGAQLGADVIIGPYAHIGKDVRLGDGVSVGQGAIVDGRSTIGAQSQIFPYALIGMKTQDLKFVDTNVTYVEIGERTVIREFTTVHLGTKDGEKTIVGSDCLIMAYCHAAHGVVIGNHVIMSNNAQLAGEVKVDDYAIIGGMAGSHQFVHIGGHCMVGGMSKIRQDVPPYMLCDMVDGYLKAVGPNVIGLTRRGFDKDIIQAIKDAFRMLYHDGLNRSQALEKIEKELKPCAEIANLVSFYRSSTRGVC